MLLLRKLFKQMNKQQTEKLVLEIENRKKDALEKFEHYRKIPNLRDIATMANSKLQVYGDVINLIQKYEK